MHARLDHKGKPFGLIGVGCLVAVVLLSTLATADPKGADMKVRATVEAPKVIAVRVRHDMCPVCRQLDPKFPELISQSEKDSVLFVTLDLTNETTQKQAALLVGALELEQAWTGDLTMLGSVTFLDGTSKRILGSVQTTDTEEIRRALRKALSSSNRGR